MTTLEVAAVEVAPAAVEVAAVEVAPAAVEVAAVEVATAATKVGVATTGWMVEMRTETARDNHPRRLAKCRRYACSWDRQGKWT